MVPEQCEWKSVTAEEGQDHVVSWTVGTEQGEATRTFRFLEEPQNVCIGYSVQPVLFELLPGGIDADSVYPGLDSLELARPSGCFREHGRA